MQKTDSTRIFITLIALLFISAAPTTMYAQTLDTWNSLGPSVNPSAAVDTLFSLAIDPGNSNNIYVGSSQSSIYRTTDGGAIWTIASTISSDLKFFDLLVDPSNSTRVVAATDSGIYISVNSGIDWAKSNVGMADTSLTNIMINPAVPATFFAIGSGGVFKSIDSGANWTSVNTGLDVDSLNVTAIASSPSDNTIIFLGTATGNIYRSTNSGVTWLQRTSITGTAVTTLVSDNVDPTIVYAGTAQNGVHRTLDGGSSWGQYPSSIAATDSLRILSMAMDTSSTRKLYVGTDGSGVYQIEIGAASWTAINSGLNNGRVFDLAIDPASPYIVWASTVENTLNAVYKYIGNRKPSLVSIGNKKASVGLNLAFSVVANDPDSGETSLLEYNIVGLPSGASYDSLATHTFNWTPTVTDTGSHVVTFQVQDQRGGSDSETVTISVNRLPVITISEATPITAIEDSLLTFTVSATDADNDTIFYSTSNMPTGATFSTDSLGVNTFAWTPSFSQAGDYTVNFIAMDSSFTQVVEAVQITVLNKNQPPSFNPAIVNRTVNEGQILAFNVGGTDLDGDPLTFGIQGSLPTGAGFDSTNTLRFSWIPTFEDSGSHAVVFSLNDGQTMIADSMVITVNNINRAPIFDTLLDTMYVNEGESISFSLNATDPDNDAIAYDAANLPVGAIFDPVSKTFSWTPTFSQGGSYEIKFYAIDAQNGSTFFSTTIIVNQPPVWSNVTGQYTQEGANLQFYLKATDADSDSISYTTENMPAGATITGSDSLLFSWTPQAGAEGMYAVTFIADDGNGGVSSTIVPITVASSGGQLTPVIIASENKEVNENQKVIFQVVATDDSPQDSLNFAYVGLMPAGGSFDANNTNIFEWIPSYAQSGSYSFMFSVTDKHANTAYDTVSVVVNDVNRAPVTTLQSDTTFIEGMSILLPLNITDPDGDPLSIIYFELPPGGEIDSSGVHSLSWTPSFMQEGDYLLRFNASDGKGGALSFELTIHIVNENRDPVTFSSLFPIDGAEVKLDNFLIWEKAPDADIDDSLSYSLEIDNDSTFGSPEIVIAKINDETISLSLSIKGVSQTTMQQSVSGEAFVLLVSDIPGITFLTDDGLYYWRVKAFDNRGGETGFVNGISSFHINLSNDAPEPPIAGAQIMNGSTVYDPTPILTWQHANDPDHSDNGSNLKYVFELSNDNFATGYQYQVETDPGENFTTSPVNFNDNQIWYFRLMTIDDDGVSSAFTPINLFYTNLILEPPGDFNLLSPLNGVAFSSRPDSIRFDWSNSSDPDIGAIVMYRLEISIDPNFSQDDIIILKDSLGVTESAYSIGSDVLTKENYYWRVVAYDDTGIETPSFQVWSFDMITSIDIIDNGVIPKQFFVEQNYPNPFNNQTIIRFGIPRISDVYVTIFTVTGQRVLEHSMGQMAPGNYYFKWNGTVTGGISAASGIYLLQIRAGNTIQTKRLMLVK